MKRREPTRNCLRDLRDLYNRRMSDEDLSFRDWLQQVQRRAELMTGVKPEFTARALLDAIEQPVPG